MTQKTGSIIHGTHRTQDLIPAFLDALREVAPSAHEQFILSGGVPAYVADEGDSSGWWDTQAAAYMLDDLYEALDAHAPDGHYFGAHPGDGSDFGFWSVETD